MYKFYSYFVCDKNIPIINFVEKLPHDEKPGKTIYHGLSMAIQIFLY